MGFWGANHRGNSEVRKILSQLEGKEPKDVTISGRRGSLELALSAASNAWLESVLRDTGEWDISMWFVRDTEDGELGTLVCLGSYRGRVRMVLNGTIEIVDHNYSTFPFSGSKEDNSATVSYVREWVRRRILPEVKEAKTRRKSESDRLAAEKDATTQKYKRKYLP